MELVFVPVPAAVHNSQFEKEKQEMETTFCDNLCYTITTTTTTAAATTITIITTTTSTT